MNDYDYDPVIWNKVCSSAVFVPHWLPRSPKYDFLPTPCLLQEVWRGDLPCFSLPMCSKSARAHGGGSPFAGHPRHGPSLSCAADGGKCRAATQRGGPCGYADAGPAGCHGECAAGPRAEWSSLYSAEPSWSRVPGC